MLKKISINQLENILSEGICHKNVADQYNLNIRLDKNFEFYYNFDSSCNIRDSNFIYCITDVLEKLDARDDEGNYIKNEIDEEYLASIVEHHKDNIIYELSKFEQ